MGLTLDDGKHAWKISIQAEDYVLWDRITNGLIIPKKTVDVVQVPKQEFTSLR